MLQDALAFSSKSEGISYTQYSTALLLVTSRAKHIHVPRIHAVLPSKQLVQVSEL